MTSDKQASDDLAFARALSDGESTAVLEFDARYKDMLRHAFSRAQRRWSQVGGPHMEDAVQDFIGFLFDDQGRRLRTYKGNARFSTWLYTVALRYFQRRLARESRRPHQAPNLHLVPDEHTDNPESLAIQSDFNRRLQIALHALGPDEQLLIKLFYFDGLNATEVASMTGLNRSAVRMRKMRCLEKLKMALAEKR